MDCAADDDDDGREWARSLPVHWRRDVQQASATVFTEKLAALSESERCHWTKSVAARCRAVSSAIRARGVCVRLGTLKPAAEMSDDHNESGAESDVSLDTSAFDRDDDPDSRSASPAMKPAAAAAPVKPLATSSEKLVRSSAGRKMHQVERARSQQQQPQLQLQQTQEQHQQQTNMSLLKQQQQQQQQHRHSFQSPHLLYRRYSQRQHFAGSFTSSSSSGGASAGRGQQSGAKRAAVRSSSSSIQGATNLDIRNPALGGAAAASAAAAAGYQSFSARRLAGAPHSLRLQLVATSWLASSSVAILLSRESQIEIFRDSHLESTPTR